MKRLAFLVLCLALTAGCNRSDSSNVVVTFDGGCLTIEDLYAHRSRMLQDPKLNTDPDRITPEFVYEHAVNMEMIITKALKEKLHQDPRIRAEIHIRRARQKNAPDDSDTEPPADSAPLEVVDK